MKHRIIYPGPLQTSEVILLTGSLYGFHLSQAASALAEGVKSRGASVTTVTPGTVRVYSSADLTGNPADWVLDTDVVIVDMGEYLGGHNFRHGKLPNLTYTRSVFFTPVADYAVANTVELPWEKEQRDTVKTYLESYLPGLVHLARPALIRLAASEAMLRETMTEALQEVEQGNAMDTGLKSKRQAWFNQKENDAIPQLERALW